MTNIIKINGFDITNLAEVSQGITSYNSDESGMDMAGNQNFDGYAQKRTLDIKCGLLTWQQNAAILQAIDIKAPYGANIDVYYPDMKTGVFETKSFHTTDQSNPTMLTYDGIQFEGLSFTLEEL